MSYKELVRLARTQIKQNKFDELRETIKLINASADNRRAILKSGSLKIGRI